MKSFTFARPDVERLYDIGNGRTLSIVLTSEGIIADVYKDGALLGTFANTADEFAEFVAGAT